MSPSRVGSRALVTGASSGIGAVYADRLAYRGHDLVLVARNGERLAALADRLRVETGQSVEVVVADLGERSGLRRVEDRLRNDPDLSMLVNNAGVGSALPLLTSDIDKMEAMIDLNVLALTRLTYAAAPTFVGRGAGVIVNIASIVGVAPELLNGVYGGTKAFVIALSQSLRRELGNRGLRVQVVLPGATDTEFWDIAGRPLSEFAPERRANVMSAEDMVDASLAGLDRGEFMTIPALLDIADLETYEAARQSLIPGLNRATPAARYGVASAGVRKADG
jgi:uncharacterized protein